MPIQVFRFRRAILAALCALTCAFHAGCATHSKTSRVEAKTEPTLAEYIRANYHKHEYQIPARDGVKLFTAVYEPKDSSQSYPIMLCRTPYSVGPYGEGYKETLGPSELFPREGFIFVYQDVRGRYMAEGEFVNMRPHIDHKNSPSDIDESTDTWDTIDWLTKNIANNNGRVGMWGIS